MTDADLLAMAVTFAPAPGVTVQRRAGGWAICRDGDCLTIQGCGSASRNRPTGMRGFLNAPDGGMRRRLWRFFGASRSRSSSPDRSAHTAGAITARCRSRCILLADLDNPA